MASEGTPLYALWNGRGAVLLFFALSGYVLTLPFARPGSIEGSSIDGGGSFGWGYFAKRWARIGVPYLVMTVVVMTASIGLSRLVSQSTWPAIMFDRPPSVGDVIEWGTLIGLPNVSAFNSVVWTLVVEIRLSMLLPLVILAFRRYGTTPVLAVTLLVALVADLVAVSQPYEGSMAASISVAGTLHFLPLFAAGSALAFRRERLTACPWLRHPGVQLSLLVVALTLYVRGHGWAVDTVGDTGGPSARPMLIEDYIVGAGAAILVGLVAAGVGRRLLQSRPLLVLGRSSYSLYLWHLPVLVASALVLTPHIGMMASAAVGLVVTVLVTWMSYTCVEAPVQRLIRTRRQPAEAPRSGGDDVGLLSSPGPGRHVR